jgi:hypothetical protein
MSLVPCGYIIFTILHVTVVYVYGQHIQGLCQSTLGITDHVLTHVAHMLQRLPSHLNGLTLNAIKFKPLYFLCCASSFPIL